MNDVQQRAGAIGDFELPTVPIFPRPIEAEIVHGHDDVVPSGCQIWQILAGAI